MVNGEILQENRSELIDGLLESCFGFDGFYGFIYFITDGEFTKIGRTRGSVQKRLDQLQIGNARQLEIAGITVFRQYGYGKRNRTDALNSLESIYHVFFEETRARGEWFKIGDDDLKKCKGVSTADDILYKKTFAVIEQKTEWGMQGATLSWLQFEW